MKRLSWFLWGNLFIILSLSYCGNNDSFDAKNNRFQFISQNRVTQKDQSSLKAATVFQQSLQTIAKKISSAVVGIKTEKKDSSPKISGFQSFNSPNFLDKSKKPSANTFSFGSGTIISKEGYIVTNAHVIDQAINITVFLDNKKEYKAKVIGKDNITDLAIIKINAGKDITVISLGDSNTIKVGNWAIAIGNPFGLSGTFTFGVISAMGRSDIDENGVFKNFIQTDAAINEGNSGGPLLNIQGEVIGINTAIFKTGNKGSVGIGFAIPSNIAKKIIKQLITQGSVDRGFIGATVRAIPLDVTKYLNINKKGGVFIQGIIPNGPADKAGLKAGDVILSVNNKKVKTTAELIRFISNIPPNRRIKIMILRNTQKKVLQIRVGKRPDKISMTEKSLPKKLKGKSWLGLTFGSVQKHRENLNLKEHKGVVITGIEADSLAEKASKPLKVGDIVESINYTPIKDLLSLKQVIKKEKNKKSYIFALIRSNRRLFSVVENK